MMWQLKRTKEILQWIIELDDDSKEAVYKHLLILQEFGPNLGRPHVDTVVGSRYNNMKELRIQKKKKVLRIFFAFDPHRNAVLLIGGDKRGNKSFYKKMIPIADKLFQNYLDRLED